MPLTLLQYEELVRRLLGEDETNINNAVYPQTLIRLYLNAGQSAIARRLADCDFLKATTTANAQNGAVAVPAGYLTGGEMSIAFVRNGARTPLECMNLQEVESFNPSWRETANTVGEPSGFFIYPTSAGDVKYELYPRLANTVTDGLFLMYTSKPTDMSADAHTSAVTSWCPDLEPILLPAYACMWLRLMEGGTEDQDAAKWNRIYEEGIKEARFVLNRLGAPSMHNMGRAR